MLGPNGLLHTKTKVLATNKVSALSIADSIALLDNGEITQQGTYDEITKDADSPLWKLLNNYGKKITVSRMNSVTPLKAQFEKVVYL